MGDGGDITGVRGGQVPDGLFVRYGRHLSRWQPTVDGAVPEGLTPAARGGTARCVLVPRAGRDAPRAYPLLREQAVGDGSFVEVGLRDGARAVAEALVDGDGRQALAARGPRGVRAGHPCFSPCRIRTRVGGRPRRPRRRRRC